MIWFNEIFNLVTYRVGFLCKNINSAGKHLSGQHQLFDAHLTLADDIHDFGCKPRMGIKRDLSLAHVFRIHIRVAFFDGLMIGMRFVAEDILELFESFEFLFGEMDFDFHDNFLSDRNHVISMASSFLTLEYQAAIESIFSYSLL